MNRKSLVFLLLGFAMLLQAQSIRKYEYWFDHDTDNRTVTETNSQDIALLLNMEGLSPGVHAFCFRAEDDKGRWSSPVSSFFIKTEEQSTDNRMKRYEYWLDGQLATKQSAENSTGVIALDLDISSLSAGVHTISFRAEDKRGQWCSPLTYYFIKTSEHKEPARLTKYEYWLDQDTQHRTTVENTEGVVMLNIDAHDMAAGVHALSFRMSDNYGQWSSPMTWYFVKPEKRFADQKILGYQYWFNDATEQATYVRLPEPSSPATLNVELPTNNLLTTVTPENIALVKVDDRYKIAVKNVLHIRFKDTNQQWSVAQTDTFKTVMSGSDFTLTPFIVNPDASQGMTGWTTDKGYVNTRDDGHWSGTDNSHFHLQGQQVRLKQTVNGLPAATYTLSAMGHSAAGTDLTISVNGLSSPAFIASDDEWNKSSITFSTNGEPFDIVVEATATNGEQWAEIDDLQLNFSSTASLKVLLAQDMNEYRDMRLVLTSSQSRLALTTTNANDYTFYGLSSNAVYRLSLQNRFGQEFAVRDSITINEGDNIINLNGLKSAQQVSLTVIDALGQDVTAKTTIAWTDEQGNYLASGTGMAPVPEGITMGYEVKLGDELGTTYTEHKRQTYTVASSGNTITMQLQPIAMTTINGRVLNDFGTVYGANVSVRQWLNGRHTKVFNTTTDANGTFALQVYNDSSEVIISYNGYLNATMHRSIFAEPNVGDIMLKPVTGVVITPEIAYQTAMGEEAYWTDGLSNIDFTIENQTTGHTVTDFMVQNDRLIVAKGLTAGDHAMLTAKSRKGVFADVSLPITVAESDSVDVLLNLVELGGLTATYRVSNNANNIGCLYDENGRLVGRGNYSYGSLSLSHLNAGDYTLVTMGKSQMLGNVLSFDDLLATGMQEGRDFITSTFSIGDGTTTEVSLDSIPMMEESRFYYTNQNTHFEANKASLTVGNYVTLSSRIEFKEEFADQVNDVSLQIELPGGCELVPNSVIIGQTLASYTYDDGRIVIPVSQAESNERVRLCVTPTESGDYTATAFVAFNLDDDVLQPIGSVLFTAEDISITAPDLIADTGFGVRGTCIPYSSVEVYDGTKRIGATTSKADGSWFANAVLDEPVNLSMHNIHALISTPANVELKTQTRRLMYNKGGIVAKSVTMIYNSNKTLFDFEHPELSIPAYTYVPSQPDFTFLVDLTKNDTVNVKNVKLHVFTSDGEVTVLDAVYDGKQDKFVASNKFYTNSLPENVSVSFDDETKYYLLREDVDRVFEEQYEWLTSLNQIEAPDFTAEPALRVEVKKYSESGVTAEQLTTYCAFVLDDKSVLYMKANDNGMVFIDEKKDLYVYMYSDSVASSRNISNVPKKTPESAIDLAIKQFKLFNKEFSLIAKPIDKIGKTFQKISQELLSEHPNIDYCISLLSTPEFGIAADISSVVSEGLNVLRDKAWDDFINFQINAKTLAERHEWLTKNSNLWGKIGNYLGVVAAIITALNIPEQMDVCIETMEEWRTVIQGIEATDCPKQKEKLDRLRIEAAAGAALTGGLLTADIKATELSIGAAIAALVPVLSVPAAIVGSATGIIHTCAYNGVLAADAATKGHIRSQLPAFKGGDDCVDDKDKDNKDNQGDQGGDQGGQGDQGGDQGGQGGDQGGDQGGQGGEQGGQGGEQGGDQGNQGSSGGGKIDGTPVTPPTNGKKGNKGRGNGSHPQPTTPNVPYTIDPSGYVYEAVSSNRIEGVTVTCYQKRTEEDMYGDKYDVIEKWDAERYSQKNPLITDKNGFYAWDVPQGWWQVKYEKDGYETVYSEWLPVPPPQLDINIGMQQAVAPEVTRMRGYESGIIIDMSKYMRPATMTARGTVTVMRNGMEERGRVELLNAERDPYQPDREFVSKVKFVPNTSFNLTDNVVVTVHKMTPESYCGMKMLSDVTQTVAIEPEITSIKCDSLLTVGYGQTAKVSVRVLPADAAKGKVLQAVSSSPMIVSLANSGVEIDTEGVAVFTVSGELPGGASLRFSIDDIDLTSIAHVSVEMPAGQVEMPVASVTNGEEVNEGTLLALSSKTPGAAIFYTIDGSCPCDEAKRKLYTGPIALTSNVTIKAIAVKAGLDDSEISTFTYTVKPATGVASTNAAPEVNIAFANGKIVIDGAKNASCRIFDLQGRELCHRHKLSKHTELLVPGAYSYIVSIVFPNGQDLVRKITCGK